MYNEIIVVNDSEYELLFSFDCAIDTYGKYSELEDKINLDEIFYFDSSYKNQLTYFNKDKSITVFCIDYTYGFNSEHKLIDFCQVVDEYTIYKKKQCLN